MNKLMTWAEVLNLDLDNMGKIVAAIESVEDAERVARLNERLANANTHYLNHKSAMKDGLQCNYARTAMSETK